MQSSSAHTDQLKMDPAELYREELFTDRKVGTIQRYTPVLSDGSDDAGRAVLYVGQTQLLTPMGPLPLSFEIEAQTLDQAAANFAAAAAAAVERAMQELQEMRREAASSIVIPEGGMGGLRGGKIQMP